MTPSSTKATSLPEGLIPLWEHTLTQKSFHWLSTSARKPQPKSPISSKHSDNIFFHSLAKAYPSFVKESTDPLDFLEQVETYIHVEVRKLYPDAELPTFECSRPNSPDQLHMTYYSIRHMEDVCEGLIRGSLEHFGVQATVERQSLDDDSELFIITKA